MRRSCWLVPFLVLLGSFVPREYSFAGGGPKNVLLVVNDNSPVSQSIASYYKAKRGIPDRNLCHVQCSTDEWVSKTDCESTIVGPIRSFIENSGVHNRIDYIVLTKGMPLRASYNDSGWYGVVSVASVLTCVGVPLIVNPCNNPYGPTAYPLAPEQYFTHQLVFSGKSYYVVTRLDAYTEQQVYRMIDDSLNARPQNGLFLMDGRYESDPTSYSYKANDRLRQANHNLRAAGHATYYDDTAFDSMINDFVGGQQNVMGYFSWGSNESSYTLEAYTSNYFLPGSIADTFVSSSVRSFAYPPSYGQSLLPDLIPQGLSAGNGYVSEPDVRYSSYPNVLFSRYVQGYNMGESFFAATPRLYWKAATIGDPLMAPYATPPAVTITSPDPERIAHGVVVVSANATDGAGIAKVEFYVDDNLAATISAPPYQFSWDTTQCADGTHLLEAIAYENTTVYTQAAAKLTVQVINTVLDVSNIGGLASLQEGRLVRLASKPVIAGSDAFTDGFYICEPDRSSGIRVLGAFEVATGSLVTVTGELVEVDGQRAIQAVSVTPATLMRAESASDEFKPLAMPNRFLANTGSATGFENSMLIYGLANVGLLVKTWGRVVQTGEQEFAISDGSLKFMNEGLQEVTVSLKNLTSPIDMPQIGTFVVVTGVSCYTPENELLRPTIRPRSEDDLVSIPL